MGVVHLAYETVSDAEFYDVYRLNNTTAEWMDIAWTECTNWDDFRYYEDQIILGQEYQYKVRAHSNDASFGSYSDIETGYAFDPNEVTITEVTRNYTESENIIVWTDPNNYDPIQNIVRKEYIVYYATESGLNYDYFHQVKTTTDLSCEHYVNDDEVYYYKIVTKYTYLINDEWGSSFEGYYEIESDITKEGSGSNNDDPEIISYTKTDLGTVVTSDDAITFTEIKQNGSRIYLGVLKDVGGGYGTPSVYMLSGNSWISAGGTLPSDITDIGNMGIAVSSSKIYLAALESDSLYS